MKTLIELYDERPIDNVLGTEVFRPKEIVILCPLVLESGRVLKKYMEEYFRYRKISVKVTVIPVSMLDASKVEKRLLEIIDSREDCAIDISGGTDASLFAAGLVSKERDVSVFTYSLNKNQFFEILKAPFARNLPCEVTLDVKSCFLMAGGTLLPGRADNLTLRERIPQIDSLFHVFMENRRIWQRQVSYIQHISSSEPGQLQAEGPLTAHVERKTIQANKELFTLLEQEGLISDLSIAEERMSFTFPDDTVKFWLRDIGAVLELQVYRSCIAAECFDDVVLSAVVNWEGGDSQRNSVTNEIDVVAVRGIRPVFISCKTSDIHTQALNELAILRDRFGGKGSKAIIVSSANAGATRAITRMRAAALGIAVVELDNLDTESLVHILKR